MGKRKKDDDRFVMTAFGGKNYDLEINFKTKEVMAIVYGIGKGPSESRLKSRRKRPTYAMLFDAVIEAQREIDDQWRRVQKAANILTGEESL